MQTNIQQRQASVVLKDGNTQLASWIHSSDQRATVGDSLAILPRFHAQLAGYEPQAVVSRIEMCEPLPDRIELEAICHIAKRERPVIVLNSDRIPESRRETVEAHLRTTLRFPLISWEASSQPDPIVRFRSPASGPGSAVPDLRSGLLDLIYEPALA